VTDSFNRDSGRYVPRQTGNFLIDLKTFGFSRRILVYEFSYFYSGDPSLNLGHVTRYPY
jgi:hypothetical protein